MLLNKKSMEEVLVEVIRGEMKYEAAAAGLGMKPPSMKFLLAALIRGLRSWKKLSDGGEKKLGGIRGSEAGPGDKTPENKPLLY